MAYFRPEWSTKAWQALSTHYSFSCYFNFNIKKISASDASGVELIRCWLSVGKWQLEHVEIRIKTSPESSENFNYEISLTELMSS